MTPEQSYAVANLRRFEECLERRPFVSSQNVGKRIARPIGCFRGKLSFNRQDQQGGGGAPTLAQPSIVFSPVDFFASSRLSASNFLDALDSLPSGSVNQRREFKTRIQHPLQSALSMNRHHLGSRRANPKSQISARVSELHSEPILAPLVPHNHFYDRYSRWWIPERGGPRPRPYVLGFHLEFWGWNTARRRSAAEARAIRDIMSTMSRVSESSFSHRATRGRGTGHRTRPLRR